MEQGAGHRSAAGILFGFMAVWTGAAWAAGSRLDAPVIFPDEFGYWAHAASMAGMDWSQVVAQHSWYSFGYGLLMYPFMAVVRDPLILYRLMTGLNFVMLAAGVLLLYGILKEIFRVMDRRAAALAAGTGLLYVSCATYAQTTLAEVFLTFLYLLLAWGMAGWLKHPGLWRGMVPVLTVSFMYMVHLRTVGIVLGTAVCMVLGAALRDKSSGRWKRVLFFLAVLVCMAALAGGIKNMLVTGVESADYRELTGANDYTGQWGKLAYLCSLEGLFRFLAGLAGKIFYLGCASFGLYFWGMAFLFRETGKLLAQRAESKGGAEGGSVERWLCLWLLLTHGAALLITTIYCLKSDRMDALLYGRYHENTVPPILAFGVLELLQRPGVRRRMLWLTGLLGVGFLAVYLLLGTGEMLYANRHSVTGILYAFDLAQRYDTRTILYAYAGGMLGGAVLGGAFPAGRSSGWRRLFLLVPCLMQLALSGYNTVTYILPAHEWQRSDVELLAGAREMLHAVGKKEVFCLYGDRGTRACLAQYMLQDISLCPVGEEGALPPGEIFLVQIGEGEALSERELSGEYRILMESHSFRVCWDESGDRVRLRMGPSGTGGRKFLKAAFREGGKQP